MEQGQLTIPDKQRMRAFMGSIILQVCCFLMAQGLHLTQSYLTSSRTPTHKLVGALALNGGDSRRHLWRPHPPCTTCSRPCTCRGEGHSDHLIGWLEASIGDLGHGQLLVVGLLG